MGGGEWSYCLSHCNQWVTKKSILYCLFTVKAFGLLQPYQRQRWHFKSAHATANKRSIVYVHGGGGGRSTTGNVQQ